MTSGRNVNISIIMAILAVLDKNYLIYVDDNIVCENSELIEKPHVFRHLRYKYYQIITK